MNIQEGYLNELYLNKGNQTHIPPPSPVFYEHWGYLNLSYLNLRYYHRPLPPPKPKRCLIQAAVRTLLLFDADVSGAVEGRVFGMVFPKNITFPCITIQRISETIDPITYLRRTALQIDCHSGDQIEAVTIAEMVMRALINRTDANQEHIISIIPTNTLDLSVPETRLFRVTSDYTVIWRPQP